MYKHQDMKQLIRKEFLKAIQKEWDDKYNNGNIIIVQRSKIPKGKNIVPAVWKMRCQQDIQTWIMKKYKARLNIDGSRMIPGIHFDTAKIHAPVGISLRECNWHNECISG